MTPSGRGAAATCGPFALAPLYAGRAGLSPAAIMGPFGGVIFVAPTAGSGPADRLGGHRGTVLAFASTAGAAAVIATCPPPAGLLAGTAVLALGIALYIPASLKLARASAGPAQQVAVIGTMTVFCAAAQTVGELARRG